jgi:uncharacterized membrane protein
VESFAAHGIPFTAICVALLFAVAGLILRFFPWKWLTSLSRQPNQEQRELWKQTKAKGKRSFVLRLGLPWGGFMFVIMAAQDLFRNVPYPRSAIYYVLHIATGLLIWSLGGYWFGLAMWRFFDSYLSDPKDKQPQDG